MRQQEKVEVRSPCGAADLLAAILAQDPEVVRRHLGLPPHHPQRPCSSCGEPAINTWGGPTENKDGFCSKCYHESKLIPVSCPQCGNLFSLGKWAVMARVKKGQKHIFCSKKCQGAWASEHGGEPRRKRDHDIVWQKHQETGWGAYWLSRQLGIPMGTVSKILSKKRKAMKAEEAVKDDL